MDINGSGMKLVAIGGGTGLSTLLRGLKHYVINNCGIETRWKSWIEQLTALVTVTDDGGSSGQLRREMHILPPGDIRNCMVALAEDEALMTQLFKYRFEGDGQLQGHSFGNLFLTAMTAVVGDFLQAIQLASEVLAIRGQIYPATVDDVRLAAELTDGRTLHGETNITAARSGIKQLWLEPARVQALPEAIKAIREADVITIGPGSLFTSILPNLLVPGIVDAIAASPAQKIFICNVMTQPGETDGFRPLDHLETVQQYAAKLHFDAMLVNCAYISSQQHNHYAAKGLFPVLDPFADHNSSRLINTGVGRLTAIHYADLIDEESPVRHSSSKLALKITELIQAKLLRLAKPA
ncbi:MAG: gluconeogenesis factor YvcK family protein [Acidobacteriota bacterium]